MGFNSDFKGLTDDESCCWRVLLERGVIQGDSVARDPQTIVYKNYIIEIMA